MYKYVLCALILLTTAEAAKILGIFTSPSYSHQLVYQPIWRELSLRGHQVTVYTPDPIRDPSLTNLTEIDLSFSYEVFNKNMKKLYASRTDKGDEYEIISNAYIRTFEAQMSSPEMKKLVANENNEQYDLFLVEYLFPLMYPFKDVYRCPMVGIVSLPFSIHAAAALGIEKHPVLDPEFILPFATNLSFKERIISTLFSYMLRLRVAITTVSRFTIAARKFFGNDTREVTTIAKEVSLILGNSNVAIESVRPTVPAFIGLSGIHLRPPKPLPQDLKLFLDEARQGVIYFSLGTNVKSNLLSKDKRKIILSAFSQLPYKVLWKFETDDIELPNNVEIRKWLPQQDILRHPNVKLFITQGGIQSLDEALSSSVPLLVIPFFGDQHFNAHRIANSGAGLSLNFYDFTKDEFVEKISKLILDPSYKRNATKLGNIAFDEPMTALEKAVWWIEYVIRHEGAPHLRYKAVDLPLYQYYLLDVHLFLASVILLVSYILLRIFRTGYKYTRILKSVGILSIDSKKSQ